MKDYQITSDDILGRNFQLTDDEGNRVENVSSATIWFDPNEVVRADITIRVKSVNLKVKLNEVTLTCPCCDEGFSHECESLKEQPFKLAPNLAADLRKST